MKTTTTLMATAIALCFAGSAAAQTPVTYPEFNGPHELVTVTIAGYSPVEFKHVASFDSPLACRFAALHLSDVYRLNHGYFTNEANKVFFVCVPQAVPAGCAASPGLCYLGRSPEMAVQP